MIYLVCILSVLWIVSTLYFLKHVRLITKELEEINKEQHNQNMDVIHLLKMDVQITSELTKQAEAINEHAKILNQIITILESPSKKSKMFSTDSDIFNSPKGEA